MAEPHNLAPGWVGFDFEAAFECPVRIINDAAMQALGSYRAGTMLYIGLGTGLGSALVVNGVVVPMKLAHLSPYRGQDLRGLRGVCADWSGWARKKWRKHVGAIYERVGVA